MLVQLVYGRSDVTPRTGCSSPAKGAETVTRGGSVPPLLAGRCDSRALWKGELNGIAELPAEMGKAFPDLLSVFLPEENHVHLAHLGTFRLIAVIFHTSISLPQMPILYCVFFRKT